MRIRSISLTWFRGAADAVAIRPDCKSMVVYGENGSGKSSFVDAIELCLHHGKIGHLSHEYSGRHQERAILNTHTPVGRDAEIRIEFSDKSELVTTINRAGIATSIGAEAAAIQTWDYRRTVLRQDEVSAFIQETKGNKYSALLPLLGLGHLEVAAENLRKLQKTVEQESKLLTMAGQLEAIETKREEAFAGADDTGILAKIEALRTKYCDSVEETGDVSESVERAITAKLASFSEEQKQELTLQEVASLRLEERIHAVRSCSGALASFVEPFIAEKLEVLQCAGAFTERLEIQGETHCPACGQAILAANLRSHIALEQKRLRESIATLGTLKSARARLCDALATLKRELASENAMSWRTRLGDDALVPCFEYLDALNVEAYRGSCTEVDLVAIERKLVPLTVCAATLTSTAPDMQALLADKAIVEAGRTILTAAALREGVERAKALIAFLTDLEDGARSEIRQQSRTVIDEICADIQRMWSILHPGEAIEGVRLFVPDGTDKAIDVRLRFHGVQQDSPRLTLSEGHRNSLGLCIFLAMAKRGADTDRPLILDDVVVSLDRNHRGMIVELLEKEFSDRQVLLFTHEREWFSELRQQLNQSAWIFTALMPYDSPALGIRLSSVKSATFDDARALLDAAPDSAGNTVRKIMDIELAIRAQRLKLRLPYLHREKNDHRMAHDFLFGIISDGLKCYQIEAAGKYVPYEAAITAFREADRLLISWGNKSSHSFDVVKKEVEKFISLCQAALDAFDCCKCGKPVYQTDDTGGGFVQCRCGTLRWRYEKK